MKIIDPSFDILSHLPREKAYEIIETAGRVCYRSEPRHKMQEQFIKKIVRSGHESVIEHVSVTAKIVCDRGVSHELVRHRLASYSQESTRYANYAKEKFGREITVVRPPFWQKGAGKFGEKSKEMFRWEQAMLAAEHSYVTLLDWGAKPEEARSVLPNSLATTIVISANVREWRHIFKLRLSSRAHPQIRQVMTLGFSQMVALYPALFDDLPHPNLNGPGCDQALLGQDQGRQVAK